MAKSQRARSLPPAPLSDPTRLAAYSAEHLAYEVRVLFLAIGSGRATLGSNHQSLLVFLKNARVEAFANHLRNLVCFLYPDQFTVMRDDVCAHHFIDAADALQAWTSARGALSDTLRNAKARADKEMAHLTTQRLEPSDAGRDWDMIALGDEVRTVLKAFVAAADTRRLSPTVNQAIPTGPL